MIEELYMNTAMRKLILRADALLLGAFGTFGLIMDLIGYFTGGGTWQNQMTNNPMMIGFVEAHGLAIISAVLLYRFSLGDRRTGHVLGAMIHILLGTANLIFWQLFLDVNQLPLGYITTSFHWFAVAANALALLMPEDKVLAV
jgi:hypothetical protein